MDQICKLGEQTSRIIEFKHQGLDFQLILNQDKTRTKPGQNQEVRRKCLVAVTFGYQVAPKLAGNAEMLCA